MTSIEQVAEFHQTFNHPIAASPCIPSMESVMFRINFIREELDELEAAAKAGDLIEYADGLGDIQYVLDGAYLNAGLHPFKDAISTEIHRSNMSKACRSREHAVETIQALSSQGVECYQEQVGNYFIVKRHSDGKVMKALGYSTPSLEPIITRQVEATAPLLTGAQLIAIERQEQIEKHGWSLENDDDYGQKQLQQAALACIVQDSDILDRTIDHDVPPAAFWPAGWTIVPYYLNIAHRKDRIGQLKVAGAFLAAEIDRLLRLQQGT